MTITSSDIHGTQYQVAADQLQWRPAAYAIVIQDGKILLTKQHGTFHLPGGGLDFGEMPEWISLNDLDSIKAGSTIDWRKLVKGLSP